MVSYKNLMSAPVFECDGLWYLRVGERRAVVLKHADGSVISGFQGNWMPAFVYTGLEGIHLLGLESGDLKVTWLVAPDGRRLGDKLTDLTPDQRSHLREAVLSRGLNLPDGLIGDGIQFVDTRMLRGILALAGAAAAGHAPSPLALSPQRLHEMQADPHTLQTHLHFQPDDGTLLLQEGWIGQAPGPRRAVGALSTARGNISRDDTSWGNLVPAASCHLLTLILLPAEAEPDALPAAIEVIVNGSSIGTTRLDPRWQDEGATLSFWLAPGLVDGKPFEIGFRHDQDFLLGGLRVSQGRRVDRPSPAAPLEPAELMLRFENIGDNCEFGLVQRHFQADPVGLLRFAGLRTPKRLIRFLEDDFGQFGEPGSLGTTIIGGEYWIVDQVYGMAYHTFRYQHEVAADAVIHENEIKVGYLKRKFREDLEDGEKIMVYKRVVTTDLHEIIALHAALGRRGALNKLLWVTQADERHAPGDVEWVGNKLLKGYVREISLTNAHDFDPDTWLRLCRNAHAAFEAAAAG